MKLLGESNSSIIVAHLTRLTRLLVRKRNPVVDVKDAVLATGRPDSRSRLHTVLLGVDLTVDEGAAANGCHARSLRLAGILGEVVGCDEASGHAFVETRPSVVGGIYDGVLEASRVLEVEVELAVLATVCGEMLASSSSKVM
jgi:hypothetical protein